MIITDFRFLHMRNGQKSSELWSRSSRVSWLLPCCCLSLLWT